ncbi:MULTISPECIES: DUF6239 family natural product biosynthesis protein [Actinoalloteichus]|uniref:Uncharacterized protein n=1 Tax=Actinoalloteichus fjordicus TaxID=1612552 RepID=A0AAC9PTC9_9PSEU|nr:MULTISPECIES: DUF6239 family natural product biosynthesis protein [Actinoalloteichus]APU15756.1 hypothetical protein UA74_18640 [Actinoalloteichus fjordicus]APU21816.1 hypothetical protein UA75_19130 [Actinoalloteichus sp. GBA129-24]
MTGAPLPAAAAHLAAAVGGHGHGVGAQTPAGQLGLTIALLATTIVAAAAALLRPASRLDRRGTTALATTAALGGILSLLFTDASWIPDPMAFLVLVCLGAPVSLAFSRTRPGLPRLTSAALLVTTSAAVAAHAAGLFAAVDPPDATTDTAVLAAFAAVAWLVVCTPTGRRSAALVRVTGIVAAIALLAGTAQVVVLGRLDAPLTGEPLLATASVDGRGVDLLIVPHRPGRNLVHVGSADVSVGTSPSTMVRATARPGAPGGWALLELGEGRDRLRVQVGERVGAVSIDPGDQQWDGADLRDPDAPEYVSAVLGQALIDPRVEVPWPASALSTQDAAVLRGLTAALAGRAVSIVSDDSPRAEEAERVVREQAARHGVAVHDELTSSVTDVVVVAGWARAAATLRAMEPEPTRLRHLAPWLVTWELLSTEVEQIFPLRYRPEDPVFHRHLLALPRDFRPAAPTAVGLDRWLTAVRHPATPTNERYRMSDTSGVPGPDQPGWLHPTVVAVVSDPDPDAGSDSQPTPR